MPEATTIAAPAGGRGTKKLDEMVMNIREIKCILYNSNRHLNEGIAFNSPLMRCRTHALCS